MLQCASSAIANCVYKKFSFVLVSITIVSISSEEFSFSIPVTSIFCIIFSKMLRSTNNVFKKCKDKYYGSHLCNSYSVPSDQNCSSVSQAAESQKKSASKNKQCDLDESYSSDIENDE